ncbi:MAG: hypothetical protein ACD_46C00194G0012 [uncultured bacterium]|nr:MAG: hypothetical protein ACD_46C00194G0012 [uncultured bacterium]
MTKSRNDIVNNPDELSLLDFPSDLLRIPEGKTEGVSITSACSEEDATTVMRTLSETCTTFHAFFKPELEKRKLLNHVLKGTEKDKEKVMAAAKTHPELFFIKTTTQDGAMDLDGNRRTIKDWSPYQALFGTSDVDMLLAVKKDLDAYLDKLKDGHQFAEDHVKEKFPNGFDFPESKYDFSGLKAAITNDQQLIQTGNPNQTTLAALEQFRKDFKPGTVTVGHHFNMKDLIKAHQVYDENWQPWEPKQLKFFSLGVIGFLERLMTRFYLMLTCQGIRNHTQPCKRMVEVDDYVHDNSVAVDENGRRKKLTVLPLDGDPALRLGAGFVIDSYCEAAGVMGFVVRRYVLTWRVAAIGKLCQANTTKLSRLYAASYTRDNIMHNHMK